MRIAISYIFITLLISGCSAVQKNNDSIYSDNKLLKSPTIAEYKPEQPVLPTWITFTPSDKSVGCAKIKNGNLVMAKQVSLAKAKAEFLSKQNTEIDSITEVRESSSNINGTNDEKSSISSDIRLKTNGVVDHSQKIYKQEEVIIENMPHWCVLFG